MEVRLTLPGSKSLSNRALLLAMMAPGISRLRGLLQAWDTIAALRLIEQLGAKVDVDQEGTYTIDGRKTCKDLGSAALDCHHAGTLARFVPGLLTAFSGVWRVDGSDQLRQRPLQPYLQALQQLGADIVSLGTDGALPLQVRGQRLRGGEVELAGWPSSQFISGLLLAAPTAAAPVIIRVTPPLVQPGYLQLTCACMMAFGRSVTSHWQATQAVFHIVPGSYSPCDYTVEADASTAGYFWALALLQRRKVRIANLTMNSIQPDMQLLPILQAMGARVGHDADGLWVEGGHWPLRGGDFDLTGCSDQLLTLCILAPFADQPVRLRGIKHTQFHESNRPQTATTILKLLGVSSLVEGDSLVITPKLPQAPHQAIPTFSDHRVAMALAVLATVVPAIHLSDVTCVAKTCPSFFQLLACC